jgi:hypothetical protein
MPLYRQYADQAAFPDTRIALTRPGADIDGGSVLPRPDAELADIRTAITRRPTL